MIGNALTILFVAASITQAAADPVFPPASGIGLEPPPGMHVANAFRGFQEGRASILIVEFPKQAYAQIDGNCSPLIAKIGATKADDVTVNGVRGFLMKGSQTVPLYEGTRPAGTVTYRKLAIVLDGAKETAMVTAQAPDGDNAVTDAQLEAALRSIVFRDKPDLAAEVAALPFSVGDKAGFRLTSSLMGATIILTEGPLDVDPEVTQPRVVVASSLNQIAPTGDRLAFAEAVLKKTTVLKTTEIVSKHLFEADGAQYAEIEATGTEGKHDKPVAIAYYIRFDGSKFIEIECVAPIADRAEYADRFRQVALSVRPKT